MFGAEPSALLALESIRVRIVPSLLVAGQAVHGGPVRLGFAGVVGDYEFLGGFALEDEALVDLGFGAGGGGQHVAGPGQRVGVPALDSKRRAPPKLS